MTTHYIDPNELEKAILKSQELGQPTAELGQGLLLLARHIVRRPRFRGYSCHDDMVGAAVLHALGVYKKYRRARGGAFQWLTTVITNGCLRYVREERRQAVLASRWGIALGAHIAGEESSQ